MAKKPLATLVRVRKLQEEQKAVQLSAVRHSIQRAMAEQETIEQSQRDAIDAAVGLTHETFKAADIKPWFAYEGFLRRRYIQKDAELATLRLTEEQRRADLEDAMKRKRIVERLQERDNLRERLEYLKSEQKLSDETAVNRAASSEERVER